LLIAASGFALLFVLTSAVSLKGYYSSNKEDWRSAAHHLAVNAQPGDFVLADGRQRGWGDALRVDRGLSYYLMRSGASDMPILPVGRGLWGDLKASSGLQGEPWGALWRPGQLRTGDSVIVEHFDQVAVLRLREPSGDTLQDTMSMLQVLLDVLPSEAEFDVYLALAEIHQQSGSCDQASLALHRASRAIPEDTGASADLSEAVAEWEELCSGARNLEHPLWRNLGDRVAYLGCEVDPQAARAGQTLHVTVRWQALARMDRDYTAFIHLTDDEGRLWAQIDRILEDNGRLTSAWTPAAVVRQEFQIPLSPDLPPGEYTLLIGVYYWDTGERLPVWDELRQRSHGDAISLEESAVID
jgi:hypothetical protein